MIVAGRDKHRHQHKALAQVSPAFVLATDARHCHLLVLKWSRRISSATCSLTADQIQITGHP